MVRSYAALVTAHNRLNNPAANVFVWALIAATHSRRVDGALVGHDGHTIARNRPTIARNRWFLAYTLVRNPTVAEFRYSQHKKPPSASKDVAELTTACATPTTVPPLFVSIPSQPRIPVHGRVWLDETQF